MRQHKFERQDASFPVDNVAKPEGDMSRQFTESQTRNMVELEELMDSLNVMIEESTQASYAPLLKERIFVRDTTIAFSYDTAFVDRSAFKRVNYKDSIEKLGCCSSCSQTL